MGRALDIFGVVCGALGSIGLFQVIASFIYYNLPSQKLKQLDDTLAETYIQLRCSVEDRLIPDIKFLQESETMLANLQMEADRVRTEVHCLPGLWRQVRAMFAGLSRKVSSLIGSAVDLRTTIARTSDEMRQEMEAAGRAIPPRVNLRADLYSPYSTSLLKLWQQLHVDANQLKPQGPLDTGVPQAVSNISNNVLPKTSSHSDENAPSLTTSHPAPPPTMTSSTKSAVPPLPPKSPLRYKHRDRRVSGLSQSSSTLCECTSSGTYSCTASHEPLSTSAFYVGVLPGIVLPIHYPSVASSLGDKHTYCGGPCTSFANQQTIEEALQQAQKYVAVLSGMLALGSKGLQDVRMVDESMAPPRSIPLPVLPSLHETRMANG
ncbi:hypothetical protein K474DRAFT_1771955 [Panus rudis PR-1116 ss-1]|nr:hypothetical protein K474DRAFT_1771955 [Panus rudis PR-1116 ss-1]